MTKSIHSHWNPIYRVFNSRVSLTFVFIASGLMAQVESTQGLMLSSPEAIQRNILSINERLESLPQVLPHDFGGSRGAIIVTSNPPSTENAPYLEIEIDWGEPRQIDLIALIPARYYGGFVAELGYLMPQRYELQLIDSSGATVGAAIEGGAPRSPNDPGGFPYLYPLNTPRSAQGLRIRIFKVGLNVVKSEAYRAALGEVFCFEGHQNVALNATVSALRGDWLNIWKWSPQSLVDGVTGLGFPQSRPSTGQSSDIGWLSDEHQDVDTEGWVQLDLGSTQAFDAVRLFAAIRPSMGHIPGIGIPQRLAIQTSKTGETDDWDLWIDYKSVSIPNPGQHPLELRGNNRSARFIRINATQFWKITEFYPAFIGFSEIQILQDGENIAQGAEVDVFELNYGILAEGHYIWAPNALVDGRSIDANILPIREWLERLHERYSLTLQHRELLAELDRIVKKRQRLLFLSISISGALFMLGATFFVARSRMREARYQKKLKLQLAGDLHDDLGSNLGCILSLSKSIETDESRATTYAPRIRQMTAESLESIRDLVQTYRGESIVDGEVVKRIHATAERMLPASIEFTFDAAPEVENFSFSATDRRNLLLFLREALHNCIQHSQASEVTIQMTLSGRDCVLMMRDNGIGIAPEVLEKEYTLFALRARAKELGASFEPDSRPNHGLTLTLTLPFKQNTKPSL